VVDTKHDIVGILRDMVRETGYNIARVEVEYPKKDELYSRAMSLYRLACWHLEQVEGSDAIVFIKRTYAPTNR